MYPCERCGLPRDGRSQHNNSGIEHNCLAALKALVESVREDERRAYSRGYNTGLRGRWPLHRPPTPPDEQVGLLVKALQSLRDGVDGFIATLCEEDELALELGPLVDGADEALVNLGTWILKYEATEAGKEK